MRFFQGYKIQYLILFLMMWNFASAQSITWKKYGLSNTQLYFFRLPVGVNNQSINAQVVDKKFRSVPEQIYFNGKRIMRKSRFLYLTRSTNVLYGQKLSFYLPANTWVFAFNYSDHFLLVDDAIKIQLTTTDKTLLNNWQLPETFDMYSDIALSLKGFQSLKLNEVVSRYIPTLSLQLKGNQLNAVGDTTLVCSLKKMPKGLSLVCSGINTKDHANQEIVIDQAIYFKNEFFFYVPDTGLKLVKNHPDQCFGKMTDIAGNIGYASGCITGMGSGKCAGILNPKISKKYRVTLIIEPN